MQYTQLIHNIVSVNDILQEQATQQLSYYLNVRNWLIGYYIVEFEQHGKDRAEYGARLLTSMAKQFKKTGYKGFGLTNLKMFRSFYLTYPHFAHVLAKHIDEYGLTKVVPSSQDIITNAHQQTYSEKGQAADFFAQSSHQPLDPDTLFRSLTFTHFTELIRIDDPLKRLFYEIESIKGQWSTKELQRQRESLLFERTGMSQDKDALIQSLRKHSRQLLPAEIVRDPYILEFTNLPAGTEIHETDLETALITHLQQFFLELGKGFCFVGRQYRIQIDNEFYYADLVFYHRYLRCMVIIELKTRGFRHEDSSQLNMYLNYFKEQETEPDENPPIGILLCTDKKENVVKYATAGMENLFVSRYKTALPTKEELQAFIEEEKKHLE